MMRIGGIFIPLLVAATVHHVNSQEQVKYSVLAIEYIGESDKPVIPIVISDSKAGAKWYRDAVLKRSDLELTHVHIVPTSSLEKLIAETELHDGILQREQAKTPSLGKTISAAIVTPKRRDTFLFGTDSAISLLDSLQKHCKDDEALRADLSHFEDRIRP